MLALILGYVLQTKKQDSRDYAETSIETGHNTHTQQFIFSPKIAMRPQNFPLVINFLFSCSCPIFYGLKWYFTMVIFLTKPVGFSSTFCFSSSKIQCKSKPYSPKGYNKNVLIFQQCTFFFAGKMFCLGTLKFRPITS